MVVTELAYVSYIKYIIGMYTANINYRFQRGPNIKTNNIKQSRQKKINTSNLSSGIIKLVSLHLRNIDFDIRENLKEQQITHSP